MIKNIHIDVIKTVKKNNAIAQIVQDDPHTIALLSFQIPESTMTYSKQLLGCEKAVDDVFYRLIDDISADEEFVVIDSSGVVTKFPQKTQLHYKFPIYDLVESFPEFFQTIELGCCITYSHHVFKTKCLTCAVITNVSSPLIASISEKSRYIIT